MQQPALETSLRSRRPAAGTLLVLAAVSLTGCIKPAQNADCVSVGMGWHACSGDATSSATGADAGSPGAIDASAAPEHLGRAQTGAAPVAADGGSADAGAERESGGASESSGAPASGAVDPAADGGGAGGAPAATLAGAGGAGASGAGDQAPHPAGGSAADGGEPARPGGAGGHAGLPDTCCHALGICVASSSLSEGQRGLLVRDSCSDAMLCTPTGLLDEPTYVPRSCHSVLQGEGRCLPECMASLAHQADHFPQDVCDAHELCAPCFDPFTGHATGLCNLGADTGPSNLPQVFAPCCGSGESSVGLCVPASYLPKGSVMVRVDCAEGSYCASRARLGDPSIKPAPCSAEVRGAGVCLPQCIADSIEPVIVTIQAGCAASEICYPCKLADGSDTNVCGEP